MTDFPLDLADQCVKCGLCLPHCPTYGLHRSESESPRGRIAIMTALANGSIQPDAGTQTALDHCLTCRACETACPANVSYGRLIDAGRQLWAPRRRWRTALVERIVTTAPGLTVARLILGIARPIVRMLARLPLSTWQRTASLLPAAEPYATDRTEPAAPAAQLVPGCVARLTQGSALQAYQDLCSRIGAPVAMAPAARCCGAIAQHNGMSARAAQHRLRNAAVLGATPAPVIHLDSGCAGELRESELGERVVDACEFLDRHWPPATTLRSSTLRVGLHVPCTQRHVMRAPDAAERLLRRLPGTTLVPLADAGRCCGAAGTHVLNQADQADALVDAKARSAIEQGVDVVISTNAGCGLHLQGALRRLGSSIPVRHPAQLLLEHYPDD